ncbi:MAG: DUF5309 family protein [Synergistaceae bacterium]|nr:DUF5309 family protein [Synergistaceae bacterium]
MAREIRDSSPYGSTTYEAVGNKDDVSEIITNIAPYDTPLYSRLRRTKATAVTHEWLEDTLGEARANKQPEGYTYSVEKVTARTRLYNYTQIMHRGIYVTQTQEVVQKYGVRSEMAYQMQKEMKALAFDCEKALIEQDTKVLGSTDEARQFGGLPYWVVSNVFTAETSSGPNLTFDLINTALQRTWEAGGKPSILLMSPKNKRVISAFTAGNTKYIEGNETHKLTHMISVLETDFGTLTCLTDRFMPNDTVYGLSPEYMRKAYLRPFRTGDIPEISDIYSKYVKGEWTLEMRAEKAHFKIEGINDKVPKV